jgi:hypothetical protein
MKELVKHVKISVERKEYDEINSECCKKKKASIAAPSTAMSLLAEFIYIAKIMLMQSFCT